MSGGGLGGRNTTENLFGVRNTKFFGWRTAKKTGGQNKDFFGGRPPGSGGRNTAQNKPELEDEIDPLTPSSNQASESNKIHL